MRHITSAALTAAAVFALAGGAMIAAPAAQASAPFPSIGWQQHNCDFDGNGFDDVLIGAPGATVSGAKAAGYASVQYSSSSGLSTTKKSVLHQNTSGVPGASEAGDGFGSAVASGDLDDDGYDDAIVGIPGEDLAGLSDAGGAVVFWGSPSGLHGSDSTWLEDTGRPRAGARFGLAIEAARYFAPDPADPDADPRDSIAVLENDTLLFFTSAPTAAAARQLKAVDTGVRARDVSPLETGFAFRSLSHGNYNEDSWADLAISGVTTGDQPGIGATQVLHGAPDVGALGDGGAFEGGPAVVSSDFNHDGQDDLAIGDTGVGSPVGGSVSVHLGKGDLSGLDPTPSQTWTQDSPGVPGAAEASDRWGGQVRLIDANADGRFGLLAAAPGENTDDGFVWVLPASSSGLTATDSWTYDGARLGATTANARFGAAIDE